MGSRSTSGAAAITLGCALALVASSASAQPAAPRAAEKETARRLMEQGRERQAQHDDKGALEAFRAADEIMHVPTTGVMVANEQVNLGMLVEARETLARVLHIPTASGEPEAFQRARANAEELNQSIEGRIPSLRIEVRGASAAAEVTVDDVAVSAAVLKFPYRVNPGHHVVAAKTARGKASREVDVRERETKDVVLEISESAPPPPGPVRPAPAAETSRPNMLAIVGFSVAGAGVIAGTVTGLLMFSKKSALEDGCTDKQCPPSEHADYSAAYTMATISTVSFIVAGVGAGVGIYGLLTRRHATPPPSSGSTFRVEPWAGTSSGGLRGSF